MKKSLSKKAARSAEGAGKGDSAKAAQAQAGNPPREEHDPLRPGDIVMLPDGGVAAIDKIVGSDAYVIEWTKQIGRGPWIFPVSELVLVS